MYRAFYSLFYANVTIPLTDTVITISYFFLVSSTQQIISLSFRISGYISSINDLYKGLSSLMNFPFKSLAISFSLSKPFIKFYC